MYVLIVDKKPVTGKGRISLQKEVKVKKSKSCLIVWCSEREKKVNESRVVSLHFLC